MTTIDDILSSAARLISGDSLRAKATRGGLWLGGASAAEQVTRFARNMLLARLLDPGAFGAMAIVLSSSSLIASLSDVGMWPAVIHHPEGGDDRYLNAAWWLGMLRAVGLYLVVFFLAPLISAFYKNSDLCGLLRTALVGILLDGLLSPRAKLAHKEMRFSRFAAINNGGAVGGVIATIFLALLLRNAWALAIGYCSENAFRCILSYVLYPGLPALTFDRRALRELLRFSRGMVGLSFLNLIFSRSDVFVLGKLYPSAALGFYAMAVNLVQTPSSFLINAASSTLLPAFSHVQNDTIRTRRILIEVSSVAIIFGLPVVAMIGVCAPSLLRIAYGDRYANASPAMVLASGVAFLNVLNSLITTQFFAVGQPALHRRAVTASAVTMVATCYPACLLFGPPGGQAAAMFAILVSFGIQVARSGAAGETAPHRYGSVLPLAFVASVLVVCISVTAQHFGIGNTPLSNVGVAVAACLFAYAFYGVILYRFRWLVFPSKIESSTRSEF